ncbi:leucine-rich repeat-containing protein 2 isoform X2 [Scophthalmus maximus]|nr:leucine-rich repeat-containing protein 2 isoform X2 [Scophthalmus maximus]XP_035495718.1 leucine-rich repeat-containing protein 2 isoform X2 [Scophthalmus maximus]XP_047185021.1 leucine-rich repeat-containing protein 2 isoform X2 [Scophthalmus maximus]
MGLERKLDVPVGDLSVIRGMWEVRVKKHRQRQKKEQQRVENSALARIDQQWQYRIYCKTLKSHELNLLHRYLERSTLPDTQPRTDEDQLQDPQDPDQSRLILQLDGDRWTSFPRELQWKTYLREWHVRGTRIRQLPDFLALFTQLTVLEIPKNAIAELPPEIGKLTELRELNVSYNRLSRVPPELGHCENLQRLELRGNHNLSELSFELSSLKRLVHLDIAENRFVSIPVCALRMSRLQLLDLSSNRLSDLPQDMDRLEQLVTLIVHNNHLSYLPHCLTLISTLKMIVVSGNELVCVPSKLCSNPDIKFIRLCDNTKSSEKKKKEKEQKKRRSWRGSGEEEEVKKDGREKEFIEAYVSTLKDRETVPYSTTKVSISCLL